MHQAAAEREREPTVFTPTRRALVVLAFAPMLVVGGLPATFLLGIGASAIAEATSVWLGAAVMLLVIAAVSVTIGRWAMSAARRVDQVGWRRRVPLAVTALVVVLATIEVVTGSRAPDPVLLLWFVSLGWLFVFFPRATRVWHSADRIQWTLAPLLTALVIVVSVTAGFFSWRFERSLDDFDRYAAGLTDGPFRPGAHLGWFDVIGRGRFAGCDVALHIDGWYERDRRWVAWCPDGEPVREAHHLSGDWYEFEVG